MAEIGFDLGLIGFVPAFSDRRLGLDLVVVGCLFGGYHGCQGGECVGDLYEIWIHLGLESLRAQHAAPLRVSLMLSIV